MDKTEEYVVEEKNSDSKGRRRKQRDRHTKEMKTALNLLRLKVSEPDGSLPCSKELMNHDHIYINYYLKIHFNIISPFNLGLFSLFFFGGL